MNGKLKLLFMKMAVKKLTKMKQKLVCTICGYVGFPKKVASGSGAVEFILWLLFLGPGLVYSIWRRANKQNICPACGNSKMISINTPVGQKLVKENQGEGEAIIASINQQMQWSPRKKKFIMIFVIITLLSFINWIALLFNNSYIFPVAIGLVVIWYLWTKREWLKKKMKRGTIEQRVNI